VEAAWKRESARDAGQRWGLRAVEGQGGLGVESSRGMEMEMDRLVDLTGRLNGKGVVSRASPLKVREVGRRGSRSNRRHLDQAEQKRWVWQEEMEEKGKGRR
jgi:hypothetical protein